MMFGESINMTQWIVREMCMPSFVTRLGLGSSLIFTLLREAWQRALGIRDRLGCSRRLLAIPMRPARFY